MAGAGRAKSIQSLCLFLHWGSLGGNTLNHSFSQIVSGNVSAFRVRACVGGFAHRCYVGIAVWWSWVIS